MNDNTIEKSLQDDFFNTPGNTEPKEREDAKNSNTGIEPDDLEEESTNGDDCDNEEYDDFDEDDRYGKSCEKYGGYNGWSDDAIDDAFEGDPDATWNVD